MICSKDLGCLGASHLLHIVLDSKLKLLHFSHSQPNLPNFSKTYSSPKDAMKADDYCVGAVGSVYYLIYNDYMDALVVPTGESWKRIEMAEFTRVYKGVNYDMGGDATLIIRQIGSKWYAYFISVEPIDDVIVSTNGKRMEQDIIIWKYYVYKGLLFLGSETDSIEINWYSTQISYDKSKWKINEAGLS